MYHSYVHLNLHFLYPSESFMITMSLHIHIILTIISNKILCISILVSFYSNIHHYIHKSIIFIATMSQWIFQIRHHREIETVLIFSREICILEKMIFLLERETRIDFARKFISALYTLVKTLSKDIVFFLVSLNFVS